MSYTTPSLDYTNIRRVIIHNYELYESPSQFIKNNSTELCEAFLIDDDETFLNVMSRVQGKVALVMSSTDRDERTQLVEDIEKYTYEILLQNEKMIENLIDFELEVIKFNRGEDEHE